MREYIVQETGYPGQLKQEVVGEIVRCKDCLLRYNACPWAIRIGFGIVEFTTKDDDFCSRGRRQDDETK